MPDGLLDCRPTELNTLLGGPTLIYLEGQRDPPLFVTVLQHGNEPTGFDAIQQVLRKYENTGLPRSLWLFISNVAAAEQGLRVLPSQADHNRVWPGTKLPDTPEAALMRQVVDTVTAKPLFASVDLHNNTGCNPHYGCVNELTTAYVHLAALFARTVVYFRQPVGVQSIAMAKYCPATTLECGQAGENAALEHAREYLDACLHLHHLPEHAVSPRDINLMHTIATAKMKPGVRFGYNGDADLQVRFRDDLDHFNFGLISEGTAIATVNGISELPFTIIDDAGNDMAPYLFAISDGALVAKREVIPSMATRDTDVIRQDCLFYVMEQIALQS